MSNDHRHKRAPGLGEGPEDYCRDIEAYLCRKNDGHLIRIVGPSFEMVCGWASRGVPITVARRGIDRCFERYYAKGPRRRPVRIDFCEADVLDVFDEWRRAVGVVSASSEAPPGRHESLPAHLERAVARLTALRAGQTVAAGQALGAKQAHGGGGQAQGAGQALDAGGDRALDGVVAEIVRELDAARSGAKGLRGRARADLLQRLAELDERLMAAVRAELTDDVRQALRREAETELAPFKARMPEAAFAQSVVACMDRLLRDRLRLPTLSLE